MPTSDDIATLARGLEPRVRELLAKGVGALDEQRSAFILSAMRRQAGVTQLSHGTLAPDRLLLALAWAATDPDRVDVVQHVADPLRLVGARTHLGLCRPSAEDLKYATKNAERPISSDPSALKYVAVRAVLATLAYEHAGGSDGAYSSKTARQREGLYVEALSASLADLILSPDFDALVEQAYGELCAFEIDPNPDGSSVEGYVWQKVDVSDLDDPLPGGVSESDVWLFYSACERITASFLEQLVDLLAISAAPLIGSHRSANHDELMALASSNQEIARRHTCSAAEFNLEGDALRKERAWIEEANLRVEERLRIIKLFTADFFKAWRKTRRVVKWSRERLDETAALNDEIRVRVAEHNNAITARESALLLIEAEELKYFLAAVEKERATDLAISNHAPTWHPYFFRYMETYVSQLPAIAERCRTIAGVDRSRLQPIMPADLPESERDAYLRVSKRLYDIESDE